MPKDGTHIENYDGDDLEIYVDGTYKPGKCLRCTEIHKRDSNTYIRVQGNIYVGESGGIIGGKLPDLTDDLKSSYFCMKCFIQEIEQVRDRELSEIDNEIKKLKYKANLIR